MGNESNAARGGIEELDVLDTPFLRPARSANPLTDDDGATLEHPA